MATIGTVLGVAVCNGIPGGFSYTGVTTANTRMKGVNLKDSAQITRIANAGTGDIETVLANKRVRTITIEWEPISTTLAGAATASVLPKEDELVTLSASMVPSWIDGTWNVVSAALAKSKDGSNAITLNIRQVYPSSAGPTSWGALTKVTA
jgi:hypothetical protein